MTSTRIAAVMLDGTKHEAVGIYMALADRLEFEHRFGYSIFRKARHVKVNEDGQGEAEMDLEDIREEDHAFLSWRLLHRADCPVGSFEEFCAGVESLSKPEFLDGPVDPTAPAPLPGTSLS